MNVTIQIWRVCYAAKETITKTKRQPTEWKKIFANDETDKDLISKMDRQLIQVNNNNNNNKMIQSKNGQ